MAEIQGFSRDGRQGRRLFDQAAQDAGAALRGLVEEERAAVVDGGQRLGGQLVLFELIEDLDGVLQRRLEAGEGLFPLVRVDRVEHGLDQQAVAAVLDVGDDPFLHRGHRVLGVLVLRHQLVALPIAALGVEDEAIDVWVLTTPPAKVDAPDGGRLTVGHGPEGGPRMCDPGGSDGRCLAVLGEAQPPRSARNPGAGALPRRS